MQAALSKKQQFLLLGLCPTSVRALSFSFSELFFPISRDYRRKDLKEEKKITQLTRYGTVAISALQGYGVAIFLQHMDAGTSAQPMPVVPNPGMGFILLTVLTLITGTMFIMWLGEQITDRGIGNGISLIIMIGIMVRFPNVIFKEITLISEGVRSLFAEVILLGLMIITIGFVILLTQGTRKIPVQYAKRVVGRKIYGGQSTNIPLRVNTAGVMPIIFAQSLMFIPSTITTFVGDVEWLQSAMRIFSIDHWFYWLVFGLLIIFFTFFYTAIAFNPTEVADNMKKHGGFIPGIRPGKRTAEYIDNILTRVTLPGSIALAIVAILPYILMNVMGIDYDLASFFGGTSLLIIVGVALDTLQQIESQLITRHYDGFLKSGKIRGRRRF